jgi:hypothetical protein
MLRSAHNRPGFKLEGSGAAEKGLGKLNVGRDNGDTPSRGAKLKSVGWELWGDNRQELLH